MGKINFVLSGGGARGFAHIGVLQAFKERNIKPSAVSGTSAGALIGAFVCDGFEPEEIKEILKNSVTRLKFNFKKPGESFFSPEMISDVLKKNLRHKNFEALIQPLFVCATDLNNGLPKLFNEGKISRAVLASCAVPILFPPVNIHGIPYADGGISNNLPVDPFLNTKGTIVGVNVNPTGKYEAGSNVLQKFDRFMHLCIHNNIRENINKLDVYIEPKDLTKYHMLDTKKFDEIVMIGFKEAKNRFDDIIRKL